MQSLLSHLAWQEHRKGHGRPKREGRPPKGHDELNEDLGGGFNPIGFFGIDLERFFTPEQFEEVRRLTEQLVIESFGGKTQLLNEWNTSGDKKFRNLKDTYCLN